MSATPTTIAAPATSVRRRDHLVVEGPAEQHGDHRIHVRVGRDRRRRDRLQQPDVGAEADQRSRRRPCRRSRAARRRRTSLVPLPSSRAHDREQRAAGEHAHRAPRSVSFGSAERGTRSSPPTRRARLRRSRGRRAARRPPGPRDRRAARGLRTRERGRRAPAAQPLAHEDPAPGSRTTAGSSRRGARRSRTGPPAAPTPASRDRAGRARRRR